MKEAEKSMSLKDAISKFISDGDVVYLAGFTHLIPFAASHEIIRQKKRNLTLCRLTPDLIYDQMIAVGCAKKVVFSWAGNPGVGMLRAFKRAYDAGTIEIEEYSHYGSAARLYAGAAGLPFMIMKNYVGTDLPKGNPLIKTVTCPYTGVELATVPALNPDVAVVHAQRADVYGNTQIWGIFGIQKEAAFASKKLIVTVEEIVDPDVIRSDANRTLIPGFIVSAVVEVPWAAHPSYAQGYYDRDNDFYLEWDKISATEESLQKYLKEWVFGVADRREYVEKLGAARLLKLLPKPSYSGTVNYGAYR